MKKCKKSPFELVLLSHLEIVKRLRKYILSFYIVLKMNIFFIGKVDCTNIIDQSYSNVYSGTKLTVTYDIS